MLNFLLDISFMVLVSLFSNAKRYSEFNINFLSKSNKFNSPSNAIYASLAITILFAVINNEVLMAIFSNMSCILMLFLICISILILRWKERNNIEAQKTHNFITGNINNIPIIVIINACVLLYISYVMLKNKFWIGKV